MARKRRARTNPWARLDCEYMDDDALVTGGIRAEALFTRCIAIAARLQTHGRLTAVQVRLQRRGIRSFESVLRHLIAWSVLVHCEDTDTYQIKNWAKYNPVGYEDFAGQNPDDQAESDDQSSKATAASSRASRTRATRARFNGTERNKEVLVLFEEQNRTSTSSKSASDGPATVPPPPSGGAGAAPPQPLTPKAEDQKQEPGQDPNPGPNGNGLYPPATDQEMRDLVDVMAGKRPARPGERQRFREIAFVEGFGSAEDVNK